MPIVIDDERYATAFNPFYPEDLPMSNDNFMERIEVNTCAEDTSTGTCLNTTSTITGSTGVVAIGIDNHPEQGASYPCIDPPDAHSFRSLLELLADLIGGDNIVVSEYKNETVIERGGVSSPIDRGYP